MPKLTKRVVDATKSASDHDVFQWDAELRGFGLRVKPTGVKSYIIQYRTMTGISRRLTIGQHGRLTADEARRQPKIHLGRVPRGNAQAAKKANALDGIPFRLLQSGTSPIMR